MEIEKAKRVTFLDILTDVCLVCKGFRGRRAVSIPNQATPSAPVKDGASWSFSVGPGCSVSGEIIREPPWSPQWEGSCVGLDFTTSRTGILSKKSTPVLDVFLKEMMSKRVVEKAHFIKAQSRLFDVPKAGTEKSRDILDLSPLS